MMTGVTERVVDQRAETSAPRSEIFRLRDANG